MSANATTDPTDPTDSRDGTLWSEDVAGGGVELADKHKKQDNQEDEDEHEDGGGDVTAASTNAAGGSGGGKKKKKKKKQQQQQQKRDEEEEEKAQEQEGELEEAEGADQKVSDPIPNDVAKQDPPATPASDFAPVPVMVPDSEPVAPPVPKASSSEPIDSKPTVDTFTTSSPSQEQAAGTTKESLPTHESNLFDTPADGETDELFGKADQTHPEEDLFGSVLRQEEVLVDEVRLEEPVDDEAEKDSRIDAEREIEVEQGDAEADKDVVSEQKETEEPRLAADEPGLFDDGDGHGTDDLFGTQPATTDAFDSALNSNGTAAQELEAGPVVNEATEDGLFGAVSPSAEDDLFGAPPNSEPFALELSSVETAKPFDPEAGGDDLFGGEQEATDDFFGQAGQYEKGAEEVQTPIVPVEDKQADIPAERSSRSTDISAVVLDSPADDPFGGPADQAEDDFFSAALKPVETVQEPKPEKLEPGPIGRSRASTKTSDLFQGDDSGDLFANIGQQVDVNQEQSQSHDQDLFGASQDDDLFGQNQPTETPVWDQNGVAAVKPAQPSLAVDTDAVSYDSADLDLMGVPEGWVDETGQWCWYTHDERVEVAKQMIADGTAEAPEKEPAAGVSDQPIEAPASVAPAADPYTPASAQAYSPLQSSTSVVGAAMPYVPSSSISRYGSPVVQPYVPSTYSPSAYNPSPYAPVNNFNNTNPYNTSNAIPKHVAPPAPLRRTTTTTAYDPPVPAARNLSRPPSAAPVMTSYAPMSYTPAPISTPASPPAPTGPPRSSGPPRAANSIKSTLGGRSTPTAYDPPVPAMSRQPSYARLKPAPEVAPPLPPLPQISPQPTAHVAPPPPPPGPPKGPSRNASFIQPPPPAGTYRPPSRARVETSDSMASQRQAAPPVPPLPKNNPAEVAPSYGPAALYTQGTPTSQPAFLSDTDRVQYGYQPQAASSAGDVPSGPSTTEPPASSVIPARSQAAPETLLTPQRGEPADLPAGDDTWPNNVSPAKARPLLREDTFQPPSPESAQPSSYDPEGAIFDEEGGQEGGQTVQSDQSGAVEDPYKPAPTNYTPVPTQQEPSVYQPYDKSPVPSPYNPYQPKIQDRPDQPAYVTPLPNAFAFPTDSYVSPALSQEPVAMGGSAYEPAPENIPKSLTEDVLERASPSARRIPCVSFGPQGQCIVVFQSKSAGNISEDGQRLLPAYGDRSQAQEVQLHQLKDIIPEEGVSAAAADWPGPLFIDAAASKVTAASKKKRDAVNAYIDARVQEIRSGLVYLTASKKDEASRHKAEATMLLLEIVQLMIAADGKNLLSDVSGRTDLIGLLSSHVPAATEEPALLKRTKTTEPVASAADLQYLSRMLVKGQQQEAQQYAIQQQLWSHALLISSVMGPQAWQSCVDAFVAQNALNHGLAQPLITAYKMFGGTQQLAPAAGQAGSWRDSVATVVANAKASDFDTLVKLADQLKQSDLVEASHICYLLSIKLNEWAAGFDTGRLALFGCRDVASTARDLEISELVEYALSFRPVAKGAEPYHGVPRLLAYKLQRAFEYFTRGQASEARAYCDAVLAQSKSFRSPNPAMVAVTRQAETLSGRIAGIAVTAVATKKGGKPNLENLGSWFEGRLTKFIAGDEATEEKPTKPTTSKDSSDKAAIGPFSHYSAISSPNAAPSLSRSSTYDSASQPSMVPGPHAYRSGSAASYRPRQPSQLSMQRPTSAMSYRPQEQHAFPEMTRISSRVTEQDGIDSHRDFELNDTQTQVDPSATAISETQAEEPRFQMPSWGQSYDEPEQAEGRAEGDYGAEAASDGSFITPMQTFMSPMAPAPSYEPQTTSAMTERPAYEDDDDDDLGLGNTSHKQKAAKDEPRTAAIKPTTAPSSYEPVPAKEEPAKPEPAKKANPSDAGKGSQSGSWLGKWWGKKEETAGPGPVKAKLGEESAFYYDKELKRWVNKTAGASEAPKPPPPPPARATPVNAIAASTPQPIAATSTSPPPSASRGSPAATLGGTAPPAAPPASNSTPPGPRSMPPAGGPRPPMNAADPPLADPLAAPPMRKGAAKGKKDLRAKYVNVL